MDNRKGFLHRPYSYRNQMTVLLLVCSLLAGFFSIFFSYSLTRQNIRGELASAQRETALYLLILDQKTALNGEEMAAAASSDRLTVSVLSPEHADDRIRLGAESMTIYTDQADAMPVTYVQTSKGLMSVSAVKSYNLFYTSLLRILFASVSFLLAFIIMGYLASGRMAKPISMMTQATSKVRGGDFSVRLPEDMPGEVGELMRSFNSMTEELSRTAYLQKDFMRSISHEFRTPISSIKGFAQLISMPGVSESERAEYIDLILQESDRLSRLSDTLLRLSALEQSSVPAVFTSFRLDEQVRQVILRLEPVWSAREIDWQLDLSPVNVRSDSELIMQVWINLIQNAIKYSPPASRISIMVRCRDKAEFIITDQGIGMDEATLKRIYEPFYQADTSRTDKGVGLGLCLVHRILDILGGTIDVQSQPGMGTTFSVSLPDAAPAIVPAAVHLAAPNEN